MTTNTEQTQKAISVVDTLKLALDLLKQNDEFLYLFHECESEEEIDQYTLIRKRNENAIAFAEKALAEQPVQVDPCIDGSCSCCWTHLDEQPAPVAKPHEQQEPVSDALHFAQWTAAKKDLSDYILVGSLSLAGIEDGEYGTSEIDPLDNTIEALQEKLVTGSDHKKVPLLAYIGALNDTSPQPSKPLTDEQIIEMYNEPRSDAEMLEFARAIEAAHGIMSVPDGKGDA